MSGGGTKFEIAFLSALVGDEEVTKADIVGTGEGAPVGTFGVVANDLAPNAMGCNKVLYPKNEGENRESRLKSRRLVM